ncbi:MAG TPA: SMP-30/gluconolactonase/LRE family protein [Jatrophihabitantaceae bacterium]|nr:SMP-30/gluconolactonase/LRE family protein [Jatrophihabitantaceae bacterium]
MSAEPRMLLDGLAFVESARWHGDRLWFAHWRVGEIIATDLDGRSEVMAPGRSTMGWSIDWLPDGPLLVTGESLLRQEPDSSFVQHSDLTGVARHNWNEIVVDRDRGNIYLNGADTANFLAGGFPEPGIVALVAADGTARQVADDIHFPNGMVITPDGSTLVVAESMAGRLTAFDIQGDGSLNNRRVWSDDVAPDGICIDTEGAIWVGAAGVRSMTGNDADPGGAAVRVRDGGEILERIEFDRPGFSYALGGPSGHTLFIVGQEWRGFDQVDALVADRTGQVLCVEVDVPRPAGR